MRTATLTLLLGLAACGSETPSPVAPVAPVAAPEAPRVDPRVERAARIAKAVAANPDGADAVLAQEGLSADELDALMYEIAEDPELSAAYAAAR